MASFTLFIVTCENISYSNPQTITHAIADSLETGLTAFEKYKYSSAAGHCCMTQLNTVVYSKDTGECN